MHQLKISSTQKFLVVELYGANTMVLKEQSMREILLVDSLVDSKVSTADQYNPSIDGTRVVWIESTKTGNVVVEKNLIIGTFNQGSFN